jgi:hypothetical protein
MWDVKCARGDGDQYRVRSEEEFASWDYNEVEDRRLFEHNKDVFEKLDWLAKRDEIQMAIKEQRFSWTVFVLSDAGDRLLEQLYQLNCNVTLIKVPDHADVWSMIEDGWAIVLDGTYLLGKLDLFSLEEIILKKQFDVLSLSDRVETWRKRPYCLSKDGAVKLLAGVSDLVVLSAGADLFQQSKAAEA